MASRTQSRSRRSRDARREPRYVAPVLDPTWIDPYAPSASERHHHAAAVRQFALRRRMGQSILIGVLFVAAIVASFVYAWWIALVGVALAGLYAFDLRRVVVGYDRRGAALAARMTERFDAVRDSRDEERLATVVERLGATFGVDRVTSTIVRDGAYNAALVPDESSLALFVTEAMVRDFELIELEGVIAHLLSRQRLGLLSRQAVGAVTSMSSDARRTLAQPGSTFRADEVAAAQIRYPIGLARALRRCAEQAPVAGSFFAGPDYDQWRWVFFDVHAERTTPELGDLDDPTLRAMALEEW